MKTFPLDLKLAIHVSPGDTYEWSQVLLARASFNGTLELLTAAWGRLLGYTGRELEGKTLCELMASDSTAAADVVGAILDEDDLGPVDLTVRSRTGEAKSLRLHRQPDEYERRIVIVAEETSAGEAVCAGRQTRRAA